MNYYLWITLCYIIEYSYIILLSSLYVYNIQECIVTLTLHCNLQGVTKLCDQKWVIEHPLQSKRPVHQYYTIWRKCTVVKMAASFLLSICMTFVRYILKNIFFLCIKKKKKSKDKKNTAELIRYMLQKIFL